ncbi:MAG: tannase/feruloyl esterase family alpha/beta hydrolase [Candidatus Hydrogenedentes bacterium]|nr:tannase/feruloyl esterase family alpha/beta hydrolase [Candidatus Hydrogenedentota bacterium]
MKHVVTLFIVLLPAASALAEAPVLKHAEIAALQLPDVRIESVAHVPPSAEGSGEAGHLKVDGIIGPAIRFEVLLPDDWNGRFAMGGGGGLVGSVQNGIRNSVHRGYATAGTDTGHQGRGTDGSWALDDLEALVNFGHVAIHRTAEVSKALIRAYYGRNPEKSYFVGCSRGGGQAMMASQRYPEDFDGIVAGAPAFHWTGFAALGIHIAQALYPDPENMTETVLSRDDLNHLYAEVMKQADAHDGLADGIIDDPIGAPFDLAKVPGLTAEQRAAIQAIYDGPHNADGPIYPGLPIGAEGGEGGWFEWQVGPIPDLVNLGFAFSTNIFKYFVFQDPDWDYSTYDFDRWKKDTRVAGSVLNSIDPDLDAFRDRGGKIILWHGWADAALPAQATIAYYEQVIARDPDAMDYARLFMIPGCYHCGGGPGVSRVDWLGEIVKWVEAGVAPDAIVAEKNAGDDQPAMARPLYPYPARAQYDGDGDPNDASNFVKYVPGE